jgi:hypothetical protein
MNFIARFMLQLPASVLLLNGVTALVNISVWWSLLITIAVLISYDLGEKLRDE